jgi:4-amino-4-deoxy-L-arabinose transferase-like glycosyltransferase
MAAVTETVLESERSRGTVAWRETVTVAVVGTAILGGIAFRWLNLQKWSLWWDEGFTLWASGLTLDRIIPFAIRDNQAPLYYVLQHYWGVLFGNSEFALRALSALFGTLALIVFYLLAKRVLKEGTAIALAFWLFAFSLRQIWYSREARAYAVASFFALLALYALVQFIEKRSAWAFALVVLSSALTLYLHNMMFFYLLSMDIVWLTYPSERAWTRRIPEILLANALIGFLFLPWAVSLLAQVAAVAGNLYWVPRPTLGTLAATVGNTAGCEAAYLVPFARKILPLSDWLLIGGLRLGLVALCGALVVGGLWRVSKAERRKTLCFLVYWLLPILLVFILSRKLPIYIDRVFTTSSIAAPIVFALPLATRRGLKEKRMYAALAVAGVTALSSIGFIRSGEKLMKNGEDWRGVIATVLTIPETNRLVLFAPPAGEIFFDYYSRTFPASDTRVARNGLHEDFHAQFPPPKSRIINENDVDRLRTLVGSHNYSEIDLVLTHEVDPKGLVVDYLDRHFLRQQEPAPSGQRIRIIPFRAVSQP